jgi:hypothetical protein
VRLTFGRFAADYSRTALLHVGVSDSAGRVSHFPANHVVEADIGWEDCLSIPLLAGSDGDDDADWDRLLAEHSHAWRGSLPYTPYTSLDNNCYAYATKFLNRIRYAGAAGVPARIESSQHCSHHNGERLRWQSELTIG